MKVLFDHAGVFSLSHGGFQTQIEQTKAALESIGVEVEYLRWWDDAQKGDVIHFYGRPYGSYIRLAQEKGIKVVMSELLTGMGSRSMPVRSLQKGLMVVSRKMLPKMFTARLSWDAYQKVDACIALTEWEAHLMRTMFDAPPERVHVVANGVEEVFFRNSGPREPSGDYLVCTATVTERKRVVELAEAAVLASVPLWIVGKPYAESTPYHRRFLEVVRRGAGVVQYKGAVSDRAQMAEIYRNARGFVLLSAMESLSLSALEAAAAGCPLLLSDLPWARDTFGAGASYCPISAPAATAQALRNFHDSAAALPAPPPPQLWREIAGELAGIYQSI